MFINHFQSPSRLVRNTATRRATDETARKAEEAVKKAANAVGRKPEKAEITKAASEKPQKKQTSHSSRHPANKGRVGLERANMAAPPKGSSGFLSRGFIKPLKIPNPKPQKNISKPVNFSYEYGVTAPAEAGFPKILVSNIGVERLKEEHSKKTSRLRLLMTNALQSSSKALQKGISLKRSQPISTNSPITPHRLPLEVATSRSETTYFVWPSSVHSSEKLLHPSEEHRRIKIGTGRVPTKSLKERQMESAQALALAQEKLENYPFGKPADDNASIMAMKSPPTSPQRSREDLPSTLDDVDNASIIGIKSPTGSPRQSTEDLPSSKHLYPSDISGILGNKPSRKTVSTSSLLSSLRRYSRTEIPKTPSPNVTQLSLQSAHTVESGVPLSNKRRSPNNSTPPVKFADSQAVMTRIEEEDEPPIATTSSAIQNEKGSTQQAIFATPIQKSFSDEKAPWSKAASERMKSTSKFLYGNGTVLKDIDETGNNPNYEFKPQSKPAPTMEEPKLSGVNVVLNLYAHGIKPPPHFMSDDEKIFLDDELRKRQAPQANQGAWVQEILDDDDSSRSLRSRSSSESIGKSTQATSTWGSDMSGRNGSQHPFSQNRLDLSLPEDGDYKELSDAEVLSRLGNRTISRKTTNRKGLKQEAKMS